MRYVFAERVTAAALENPYIVVISGDFGFHTFDALKAARPRQYHNVGVCEQAMVSVAAGMAIRGMIPVLFAITPFLLERAFEQIKLDVGQQHLKVILCGYDNYRKDGPTHCPLDAQAMCSLVKNLDFIQPEDEPEVREAVSAALDSDGPTFIHLTKAIARQAKEPPILSFFEQDQPTEAEILSLIKCDQL
jgi:transketolase